MGKTNRVKAVPTDMPLTMTSPMAKRLLAPAPLGTGAEGKALLDLFRRACPLGQHQMTDCDGILIDVAAA